MSFREAMPHRTTHQGLCPWTPLGDLRSSDPLCSHLQILARPLRQAVSHLKTSVSIRRRVDTDSLTVATRVATDACATDSIIIVIIDVLKVA